MNAGPTYRADATYLVAFSNNLTGFMVAVAFVLIGVGLILFGLLSRKSRLMPNWFAIASVVGGVFGIINAYIFYIGEIVTQVVLILLAIVVGYRLLVGKLPSTD